MTGGRMGALSIHALRQSRQSKPQTEQVPANAPAADMAPADTEIGTRTFSQQDLNNAWFKYATQLPREEKATAERMKNMVPELQGECQAEVLIDNAMLMDIFQKIQPEIQAFLQRSLDNRDLCLNLRLREHTDKRKAYSQKEQWAALIEKRPALEAFGKKLKLELA